MTEGILTMSNYSRFQDLGIPMVEELMPMATKPEMIRAAERPKKSFLLPT